jgi:hypothetical protein
MMNKIQNDEEFLPPQLFLYCFQNIYGIIKISNLILRYKQKQDVGEILRNVSPFLRYYDIYMNRYNYIVQVINMLLKTSREFQQFIAKAEEQLKQHETNTLSFFGHLILPIQRIPRYSMILKQMLSVVDPLGLKYDDLHKAHFSISLLLEYINNHLTPTEIKQKSMKIYKSIKSLPMSEEEFLKKKLCFEGPVIIPNNLSVLSKSRYLFLMNDVLIVCKKDKKQYVYHNSFNLNVFSYFSNFRQFQVHGQLNPIQIQKK